MRDPATDVMLTAVRDDIEAMGNFHGQVGHSRELERRGRGMPVGRPGRAEWLVSAGESWHAGGDLERALACFRDAQDDGGPTWVDVRVELAGVLFDTGDEQAAEAMLRDLRADVRSGIVQGPVHAFAGEVCEEHGRPQDALRWFDSALGRASMTGSPPDVSCLDGHFRVRRALGLPHDVWDDLVLERRRG